VSGDDTVRLELEQEVSDIGGKQDVGNGITQPIITSRSAKTTVVAKDQQTLVIGGLIANRNSDSESKIPLLGDLPLIGWLFKGRSADQDKTNLLIVLTPYVVRSTDDFRKIYKRKMEERKEFVDAYYGDASKYNPFIDYEKKKGPLGQVLFHLESELLKAENGGPGMPGEIVVSPTPIIEEPETPQLPDTTPLPDNGAP
jgi:general secretion pathway protein D